LNPHSLVEIKKNDALIYNTLNCQLLEYKNNKLIAGLIKRLNSDKNLYVIKIKEEDINRDINRFINDIRASYSGDIIDISLRPNKPVQLKPILSLQKTFDELTSGKYRSRILSKDEVKDYLSVINLYINERCERHCRMCKRAYRQFHCCTKNNDSVNELSIDSINKLLDETRYSKLYKINILGGNVFKHSALGDLVSLLNTLHLKKEYHIHYLNMVDYPLFQDINNKLSIIVDSPLDINGFKYCMGLIKQRKIKRRIRFVVEETGDIQKAETVISTFSITDFEFAPYYNGDNFRPPDLHVLKER
jgi:pseudo-rSAM protein